MHAPDRIWQPATVLERRDGRIRLRMQPGNSCARCARGEGCGAGVFSRLFARRSVLLDLPDTLDVRAGTTVQVGVEAAAMFLVNRVETSASIGTKSLRAGSRRTSSNVSASSVMRMDPGPVGPAGPGAAGRTGRLPQPGRNRLKAGVLKAIYR